MKTYRIEIADSVKADMREATRWIGNQASPAIAAKWLTRIHKAINTLRRQPLRCPLADENDKFPEEIQVLIHGKRHSKYRIVFTIRDDTVVVLYVRHGARDELNP